MLDVVVCVPVIIFSYFRCCDVWPGETHMLVVREHTAAPPSFPLYPTLCLLVHAVVFVVISRGISPCLFSLQSAVFKFDGRRNCFALLVVFPLLWLLLNRCVLLPEAPR